MTTTQLIITGHCIVGLLPTPVSLPVAINVQDGEGKVLITALLAEDQHEVWVAQRSDLVVDDQYSRIDRETGEVTVVLRRGNFPKGTAASANSGF